MGVSGRRVATLCRWGYGIPPMGDLFTYCMGRPCIFGLQPCQACQSLGLTMLDICFKHRFVAFVLIHQICISIYIYTHNIYGYSLVKTNSPLQCLRTCHRGSYKLCTFSQQLPTFARSCARFTRPLIAFVSSCCGMDGSRWGS